MHWVPSCCGRTSGLCGPPPEGGSAYQRGPLAPRPQELWQQLPLRSLTHSKGGSDSRSTGGHQACLSRLLPSMSSGHPTQPPGRRPHGQSLVLHAARLSVRGFLRPQGTVLGQLYQQRLQPFLFSNYSGYVKWVVFIHRIWVIFIGRSSC